MRGVLKEKQGGIFRVLRSAGQLRTIRGLVGKESDYDSAYNYLRGHARWMNYAEHRRLRVPIGSGVTEAACKIVFSQRFKCAGMKWGIESGASILSLPVIALSGLWSDARNAMFNSQSVAIPSTPRQTLRALNQNAAKTQDRTDRTLLLDDNQALAAAVDEGQGTAEFITNDKFSGESSLWITPQHCVLCQSHRAASRIAGGAYGFSSVSGDSAIPILR